MMKNFFVLLVCSIALLGGDIIIKQSSCGVDKTINNIQRIVKAKGLGVFAIINHSGNAKAVGMKLKKSKMIIFGNPKMGTKLMQQDITTGLDLPIRILVYKDQDGSVKMAYRDGSWLAAHHLINTPKMVQKLNNALDKITTKAGQCKRD